MAEYNYDWEDLEFLEKEEEKLQLPAFNDEVMLEVGLKVIEASREFLPEKVSVQIYRVSDGCAAFQYVADEKTERNLLFAKGKKNACLKGRHSSFYAFVKGNLQGRGDTLFQNLEEIPAAGAYPLQVNGEIVAVLAVSGLHDGNDHRLIVKALSDYLHQEYTPFTKTIV